MSDGPQRIGVVIPVRGFRDAYHRLADALDAAQRYRLAEAIATKVITACRPHRVVVVTNDVAVATWARAHDAEVIADPGSLNEAADAGRRYWADRGMDRVVIVHADLVLLESLDPVLTGADDVVLVPCHRNDGTPIISIPAATPFAFAYGPGSFARHCAAHPARIVDEISLRVDIDVPEDLMLLPEPVRSACGIEIREHP